MNRYLDLSLKIIAWSLMLFAFLILILKWFGVIHSPTTELLAAVITAGVFLELGRLEERSSTVKSDLRGIKRNISELKYKFNSFESKIDLVWSKFKKNS